jgi:hypothetical protein
MPFGVHDLYPPARIELLSWKAGHHLADAAVSVGHCLLKAGKLHGSALQYLSGAVAQALLVDGHGSVNSSCFKWFLALIWITTILTNR